MFSKPGLPSALLLVSLQWLCANLVRGAGAPYTPHSSSWFNDTEFSVQEWVFRMINVYPVWEKGFYGKGVRIRINDGGVDFSNEEFKGRFDVDASCDRYEPYYYEEYEEYDQHGTIVASLIGAAGNNGCSVGVAPEVRLSSCVVSIAPKLDRTFADGSYQAYQLDQMDISQNSYSYVPCQVGQYNFAGTFEEITECPFLYRPDEPYIFVGAEYNLTHPCDVCEFPSLNPGDVCSDVIYVHCDSYFEYEQEACRDILDDFITRGECTFFQDFDSISASIEKGAKEGRDGKGIIYVYASGNNFVEGDNTNFQQQGRFIIFVGAIGKDTQHSLYSTAGASVFLTAPAGDWEDLNHQVAARAGGGCQAVGLGTSYSSPLVSGVIALMLEANPDLTWRDVQGILAETSRPITHNIYDDESRTTNGAGLSHSNLYGFGLVDAMGAVTAAEKWVSYGEEQLLTAKVMDLNLEIGDDPNSPIISDLTIGSPTATKLSASKILVENVEVDVYLQHLSRGHLKISLISPNGTVSELTPGSLPENGQDDRPWDLRTVRSWGEQAEGTWTLMIVDDTEGDVSDCADVEDWKVFDIGSPVGCEYYEARSALQNASDVDLANSLIDFGAIHACCSCGGGQSAEGSCVNKVGFSDTCAEVEDEGWCKGRPTGLFEFLVREDSNGRPMREACCVGGGGRVYNDPSEFQDQLLGWELRIYGHEEMSTRASSQPSIDSQPPVNFPPSEELVAPVPGDVEKSEAFDLSNYLVCFVSGIAALSFANM